MTEPEENTGKAFGGSLAELAEKYLLGSMLWHDNNIEIACKWIGPEDYYAPHHGVIHRAILAVRSGAAEVDTLLVQRRLIETGELGKLPTNYYLSDLRAIVETVSGNTEWYARMVADESARRQAKVMGIRWMQATEIEDPQRRAEALAKLRQDMNEPSMAGRLGTAEPLDWAGLLEADYDSVEFLTDPLLQPGGQIALVGDGKSGKSLFSLEWALSLANGRPFLGNSPDRPYRCMIVDEENPHPEIQRRLRTLGYHAPELLQNLTYLSFPHLPPLDTPAGADALVSMVDHYKPEVIWLDTISRMIQGEENTADTWLQLYRLSLVQLKSRGISTVRLDHLGKDRARGSRGSSAKAQDVDHVWELSAMPGGRMMQLRRTHSRNGIGADLVVMQRLGHPQEWGTTTHQIETNGEQVVHRNEQAMELCRWLDERGVDRKWGRPRIARYLKDNERGAATDVVAEAIRIRRATPEVLDGERIEETPHPGHDPLFDVHADGTEIY